MDIDTAYVTTFLTPCAIWLHEPILHVSAWQGSRCDLHRSRSKLRCWHGPPRWRWRIDHVTALRMRLT